MSDTIVRTILQHINLGCLPLTRAAPLLLVVLSPFVAVLSGCERSSVEPEEFNPIGSVSFSYRGAQTGTYQATGEMKLQPGGLPQLVTGATAYQQDGLLNVIAFRSQTAGRGDFFSLLLGEAGGTGSFQLDPLACTQATLAQCRTGFFIPDLNPAEFSGSIDPTALASRAYVMALGNVTITARTSMRLRGTFQGLAFRGNEQSLENLITISSGAFDVPIPPAQ